MAATKLQTDSAEPQAIVREFFNTFRCNMGTTPFAAFDMSDQATILTASAKSIVWVLARDFHEANATGIDELRGEIIGAALDGAATLLSLAELSTHLAEQARRR